MSKVTLGLDLGPNSIGWALVDDEAHRIIDLGVRVFPEGVDNFDTSKEVSRNEQRRIARGMRRQIARRARRRRKLREALIRVGLYPNNPDEQRVLEQLDPYALRAKSLDERLTLHEFGRVLLHLNQRRGFKSNRKGDRGDAEVKGMLAEISELASDMGDKTLGEYLNDKVQAFCHVARVEDDHIRNRHTRRDMLESEFDAIWNAQARHYPDKLTTQLRDGVVGRQKYPRKPRSTPKDQDELETYGLHGLIFFQRALYWPRSVIGLCELEPKLKRCPRADRHAQRFRVLQEINNLRYIDPDENDEKKPDDGQRAMVQELLATRDKVTFDQIRKKLGFLETVKFNLERGKRASIKGMVTDKIMEKAVGKPWHKRSEQDKDVIVRLLLDADGDEDVIAERLITDYEFTSEQAQNALAADLPDGYTALSLVAIDKLMPYLERGLVYQSASDPEHSALHAAGYLRRDELQRRIFDKLPDLSRLPARACAVGDIPNPVVKRALVELRKLINAIIREYGKPDVVHLEMARSVRMGSKARSEYNTRIREREADRDAAADAIRKRNLHVSRDAIARYLLWQSQAHECIYCSQPISQDQLFGGDVDVDHILPYSRCLDDSQANKVVCHRRCNQDKGQKTPHEWLADTDPTRYESVCQQAGSLMRKGLIPYGKYRKLLQKTIDLDDFIARQLVDTSYIARATGEYLRCLFEHPHDVLGLKGQHTAELRRQWGLNTVLRHDDEDVKNREDHRHHAVDALIVALMDRSRLSQLGRLNKSGNVDRQTGEVYELPQPWESFRDDVVDHVNSINVSHRVQRKVSGALHEDSFYGPTNESEVFVKRKPLDQLSPNEVKKIRDDGIRRIVQQRLKDAGVEFGRGKKPDRAKFKQALVGVTMPSGVPIKKVRLLVNEKTIQPIREGRSDQTFVKPGSTHHLCIFEWNEKGKTKRDAVFVTMLEAMNRIKRKQPIIHRVHPDRPDAKFIMSLSAGEMVLVSSNGEDNLLTYVTAASTSKQMWFVEHTDARRSSEAKKFSFMPSTLNACKVTVDPLGRIRWAHD